jgi:hypothetical protein
VALLGLAVLALAFAHAWDSILLGSAPRAKCFETFGTAQWPKWIGCAMAAHESLAAGLIGLWAAIFAAWVAYSGIQMQIEENRRTIEENRRNIQMQIEEDRRKTAISEIGAKAAAVTAITQAIHAAAATLYSVTQAQKAQDQQHIELWDGSIERGVSYIEECLNNFTVREAVRDLGIADRVIYMQIVAMLGSFVTINKRPSEHLDRDTRLKNRSDTLMKLRKYLHEFDLDLAAVYESDAKITQQS